MSARADWLTCPNCSEPTCPPARYADASDEDMGLEAGEPIYEEREGECEECWALWFVGIDDDTACIGWNEHFADHGQRRCDGSCGAVDEWLGTPCSRKCGSAVP